MDLTIALAEIYIACKACENCNPPSLKARQMGQTVDTRTAHRTLLYGSHCFEPLPMCFGQHPGDPATVMGSGDRLPSRVLCTDNGMSNHYHMSHGRQDPTKSLNKTTRSTIVSFLILWSCRNADLASRLSYKCGTPRPKKV